MFAHFLADETGAISVDWVVLSSGIVGLGLGATMVVSAGVESLSYDAANSIANSSIRTRFASLVSLFDTDFSNGASGWLGGTVMNVPGFGEILQLGQNELAQMQFSVPPGTSSVTVNFDLIGADDLDGDPATIFVNGQAVAIYTDDHGNITTSDIGVAGIDVQVAQQYTNTAIGAGSHGNDSRATYSLTVQNPGETVTLGIGTNNTAGSANEFYAIDDVSVVAN